jgi:uncharacterized repeat protein (TIGR02543 family)
LPTNVLAATTSIGANRYVREDVHIPVYRDKGMTELLGWFRARSTVYIVEKYDGSPPVAKTGAVGAWGVSAAYVSANNLMAGPLNDSPTGSDIIFSTAYTITFNANGGSGAPSSIQTDSYGSATIPSKTPSRSGYSFVGWAKSSSATSKSYTSGSSYSFSGNITLYAVWKADETVATTKATTKAVTTTKATTKAMTTVKAVTTVKAATTKPYTEPKKVTVSLNKSSCTVGDKITASGSVSGEGYKSTRFYFKDTTVENTPYIKPWGMSAESTSRSPKCEFTVTDIAAGKYYVFIVSNFDTGEQIKDYAEITVNAKPTVATTTPATISKLPSPTLDGVADKQQIPKANLSVKGTYAYGTNYVYLYLRETKPDYKEQCITARNVANGNGTWSYTIDKALLNPGSTYNLAIEARYKDNTVESGWKQVEFTVQPAQSTPFLTVTSGDSLVVSQSGGRTSVESSTLINFNTNTTWSIKVDVGQTNWIHNFSPSEGGAVNSPNISFDFDANPSKNSRSAIIFLYYDVGKKYPAEVKIKVTQQGNKYLDFSPNKKFDVPYSGGEYQIDIKANTNWQIAGATENGATNNFIKFIGAFGIKQDIIKGSNNGSVKISVLPNNTTTARNIDVVLYCIDEPSISKTIKFTLNCKQANTIFPPSEFINTGIEIFDQKRYVNSNNVPLYANPQVNFQVLVTLNVNDIVEFSGQKQGNWAKVRYLGITVGWIDADKYLRYAPVADSLSKKIIFYDQTDSAWGRKIYSNHNDPKQTIGYTGCAPTTMAMIISTFKEKSITPDILSAYSVNNNYRIHEGGTDNAFAPAAASEYGLTAYAIACNKDKLISELNQNALLYVGVNNGMLTSEKHIIVVSGYGTENGIEYFAVYDPNYSTNLNVHKRYSKNGIQNQGNGKIFVPANSLIRELNCAYAIKR